MAKKFVRGITDIKTINNQDFDTNNVNDLLSDGKHNYIHRKKQDGSEEYHNLTNNLKTLQSDNTDLLTVTNYNNTTNSATIRPKHDSQKEQLLESTDETILISHGKNGTEETTNVDVNPAKVLEHDNLISNSEYITIEHEENSNTSVISTDELDKKIREIGCTNLYAISKDSLTGHSVYFSDVQRDVSSGIISAKITGSDPYFGTAVSTEQAYQPTHGQKIPVIQGKSIAVTFTNPLFSKNYVSYFGSDDETVKWYTFKGESQFIVPASNLDGVSYITLRYGLEDGTDYVGQTIETKVKIEYGTIYSDWSPAPEDVNAMIGQKQNTLTSNSSIGVDGTGLMQLYSYEMSYSKPLEGALNTYAKTVKKATQLTGNPKLEYHFTAKLNEAIAGMSVDLEDDDETYFSSILTKYGESSGGTKTAMINGLIFTLNGSQLTVSRDVSSTAYYQVVSFCDIIDPSQDTTQ